MRRARTVQPGTVVFTRSAALSRSMSNTSASSSRSSRSLVRTMPSAATILIESSSATSRRRSLSKCLFRFGEARGAALGRRARSDHLDERVERGLVDALFGERSDAANELRSLWVAELAVGSGSVEHRFDEGFDLRVVEDRKVALLRLLLGHGFLTGRRCGATSRASHKRIGCSRPRASADSPVSARRTRPSRTRPSPV